MSKIVKLTGLQLGGDIETVDIYHTSITGSNLISSSVSASLLISPGITFEVEDNITTFLAYVSGGLCFGTSGSVTASVYSPNTRYFNFYISGTNDQGAEIEMTYPFSIGPTNTSFSASVNFSIYPNATVEVSEAVYPNDQFKGWFYGPNMSTPFLDSGSRTLTLTLNTFTGSDDIYAYFEDA